MALSAAGCGSGIACLYCPRITTIEDKLLEALAAASGSDHTDAETLLRQIMPAAAARTAAPHAARFARAIAQAGLQWPSAPTRESHIKNFDAPLSLSGRLH